VKDFGLVELEERFPAAYGALPEPYRNDSCLVFFVDINGNLCAELDIGGEYLWTGEKWVTIG
jgi:hypothetical protein